MQRRDLLTMGAGALAGAVVSACQGGDNPPAKPALTPTPTPGSDARHDKPIPVDVPFELPHSGLHEATFEGIARVLGEGAETSRSLVVKYRARIEACNERGPALRCVIALDPDAEAHAAELDVERAAGKLRSPIHGIPILVKDNIDTGGGTLATTAGSLALDKTFALADAPVVAKLRAAGAIILGKTNLSEWANLRGRASSSGWSAVGGQCKNPYALDRSASGSSSGSAAAVAASLCAAALGSETDGSITSPASCTGLVGIKPTIGVVSRTGVIPISASQDTVGPLARTVHDAAWLLTAIAGEDPADPATVGHPREDYSRFLNVKALQGVRLGVPRALYFGASRHMDEVIERALLDLARLGAVIVDPIDLMAPPELTALELVVMQTEMKVGMAAYLATRGPDTKPRTLADLIAFNNAHADRELGWFGQELFDGAEATTGLTSKAYLDARATCLRVARTEGIDRVMDAHKLDAIVAGTSATAWLIDSVNGDGTAASCTQLAAIAGYPHVSVPAGAFRGLPIGLSFFGRAFSDAKLLAYAYAYEQATHARTPPRFLATAT